MRNFFLFFLFFLINQVWAQPTFKIGWNTYKAGSIVHECNYDYSLRDTSRLFVSDSSTTLCTADSLVTLYIEYRIHENCVYKTASFFNKKRQKIKSELYKDDNLQVSNEWTYDDKNRSSCHVEQNKVTEKTFKKNFTYASDKKSGELVVTESSYYNGKIEFYTKSYYNRNNVKYKEVRLNDNNKDIVHIESYTYGENGRVKERTVYFPEFGVTKKFNEEEGNQKIKCFRTYPMGTIEKVSLSTRVSYIKRVLAKNQGILSDKDCSVFEYKFTNSLNCEIVVRSTKVNNGRIVSFRLKERLL